MKLSRGQSPLMLRITTMINAVRIYASRKSSNYSYVLKLHLQLYIILYKNDPSKCYIDFTHGDFVIKRALISDQYSPAS